MGTDRLLIVTGAGASCELGAAADGRMLLMQDWAPSLAADLEAHEPRLAEQIGLAEPSIRGDEFERRLGQFFTFERSLALIEEMRGMGGPRPLEWEPGFVDWLGRAQGRCQSVIRVVRRSLLRHFSADSIEQDRATAAYTRLNDLLVSLGMADYNIATTNYDLAVELAFDAMGKSYDDGFRGGRLLTQRLDLDGWAKRIAGNETMAGVLHLHGAVGWYEREGEIVRHPGDAEYNETLGVPAILPPDDTKSVSAFASWAAQVWEAFDEIAADATHVLVFGHSLHDDHLVQRLARLRKVLVGVHDHKDLAEIQAILPSASTCKFSFGPKPDIDKSALIDFFQW